MTATHDDLLSALDHVSTWITCLSALGNEQAEAEYERGQAESIPGGWELCGLVEQILGGD